MNSSVAAGLALIAMTTQAYAGASILATGHLYGGDAVTQAACYLNNVGSQSVGITEFKIIDEAGTVYTASSCNKSLAEGGSCFIYSDVTSAHFYSCSVRAGTFSTLRGSLELRATGNGPNVVLTSQPLR